jgi:hypothetical protein
VVKKDPGRHRDWLARVAGRGGDDDLDGHEAIVPERGAHITTSP